MNFLMLCMALLAIGPAFAHADEKSDELLELAKKTASQWTWGASTNGVVGGIYVGLPTGHETEYRIFVHEQFKVSVGSLPPTLYSEPNSNAFPQGWFLKQLGDTNMAGMYFKATNYFCGPVTLRYSDGIQVPLRSDLVSVAAYPSSFRRLDLGYLDDFHAKTATRLFGRLPELARFKLEDIFVMKEQGDYVLTVWPKIYRQLKNGDDLCERVDLPPISLKIHWAPPPGN